MAKKRSREEEEEEKSEQNEESEQESGSESEEENEQPAKPTKPSGKTAQKKPAKSNKKSAKGGERKKRKQKDKNAPKRPLTAFLLFSNANREDIKKSDPNIKFPDVARKLADMWRNADNSTKTKFDNEAAKEKAKYIKVKAAYDNGKPSKDANSDSEN